MATLSDIRFKYPEYKDMSDASLADAFYKKFYSDMPREQFNQKIGFSPAPTPVEARKAEEAKIPEYGPALMGVEGDPYLSGRDIGEMARGAVSSVLGAPGEAERLMLRGTTALGLTKPEEKPVLPSSEDVEKKMFGAAPTERAAGYRTLGGIMGGAAAPGVGAKVGEGVATGAKVVGRLTDTALGVSSGAARIAMKREAAEGISTLTADAQRAAAEKTALDAVKADKAGATVLEVSRPAPVSTEAITSARGKVRDLDRQLSDANTKLQSALRDLAAKDKYAGSRRSQALVSAARRNVNVAQRDVNKLTQERAEAADELAKATSEHKDALSTAKEAGRKEATTEKKIASQGAAAEKQIANLRDLRQRLDAAKSPEEIAGIAKQLGKQLSAKGKLPPNYYVRVNDMIEKSKSTARARKYLLALLGGGLLTEAISPHSGVGYAIRRSIGLAP